MQGTTSLLRSVQAAAITWIGGHRDLPVRTSQPRSDD